MILRLLRLVSLFNIVHFSAIFGMMIPVNYNSISIVLEPAKRLPFVGVSAYGKSLFDRSYNSRFSCSYKSIFIFTGKFIVYHLKNNCK